MHYNFIHSIYIWIEDCAQRSVSLYFNRIYDGKIQEKFEDLKPYLESFMRGETVCVLTHGMTGGWNICNVFEK